MPCWKFFNAILEEAGVEVSEENRDRLDKVFSDFVEEKAKAGKCSLDMPEASAQIHESRTLRQELLDRVREAAGSGGRTTEPC